MRAPSHSHVSEWVWNRTSKEERFVSFSQALLGAAAVVVAATSTDKAKANANVSNTATATETTTATITTTTTTTTAIDSLYHNSYWRLVVLPPVLRAQPSIVARVACALAVHRGASVRLSGKLQHDRLTSLSWPDFRVGVMSSKSHATCARVRTLGKYEARR